MADGASLIFGVLLGPAVRQQTEDNRVCFKGSLRRDLLVGCVLLAGYL